MGVEVRFDSRCRWMGHSISEVIWAFNILQSTVARVYQDDNGCIRKNPENPEGVEKGSILTFQNQITTFSRVIYRHIQTH